ncbi:TIGR02221 family CRISPR-associated protein [Fervidibacillus halotolerans]|uniref:TIGR02221 family CRISPR-associated protein n=1 Tax=Fervidibacillus halotolerans TaxID=2980027 RepID=A0A9E8LYX6_9BACI|nr:TIGR02221 family CRISPR-associated protein [Fervidibacillus halotolerans]WAA11977.1 TIGR02221 family CRISPR-associated protein [Fervidibacillus halotolerans]
MKRKMISFLGPTRYETCEYYLGDVVAKPTEYIQKAIVDIYRNEGIKIDEIHMLLTPEAKNNNWLGDEKLYDQLQEYVNEDKLTIKIHDISSKQEINTIWNLFEIIINSIEKEDRIVFDITHSFRFQPMLALLSLHFARITKNILVDGIFYGVYDPKSAEKKFPIIDLTSFVELQDWITNVYAFIKTGRVESLSDWLNEKSKSIQKVERQNAVDAKQVEKLAKSWSELVGSLQTNRSPQLPEVAEEAINSIENIKSEMLRPIFNPLNELLSNVEQEIKPLVDNDPIFSGIAAIEWCYNHGLYQQSYTLADELVITAICIVQNWDVKEYSYRKRANDIINEAIKITQRPKEHANFLNHEDHELIKELLQYKELLKIINKIKDNRNDINHAGWRKNPLKYDKLEKHFNESFKDYKQHLLKFYKSNLGK